MLKILLVLAILASAAVLAVNVVMVAKMRNRIMPAEDAALKDADCILVLGAGVRADGSPSHMLADRLLVGIDLYKSGRAPKLLMSGDHGTAEYDEVNTMRRFALDAGVPADDIFMDHAGFSTYDSLSRAREVFGARRVIIVTQEYHLYRALWIAQALGMEAIGVCADLRTYIGQSMRDAREIAARCKDFVTSLVKPAPSVSGDPIDLKGSGRVTEDGK